MPSGADSGLTLGLAFHPWHLDHLSVLKTQVDFFEIIPESFMSFSAGPEVAALQRLRQEFPLTFHGVSLGLGGAKPIDSFLAKNLCELTERYEPLWISEHCCFTSAAGFESFELIALPHTKNRLQILCENIHKAQETLGKRIFLENVSRYIDYRDDEFDDCSFITEACRRTGCGVLFDVNNHVINCLNRGLQITEGLENLRAEDIIEIHFAGHSWLGDFRFDSHTLPPSEEVNQLLEICLHKWGLKPVVLECDDPAIPYEAIEQCLSSIQYSIEKCRLQVQPLTVCHPISLSRSFKSQDTSQTLDFPRDEVERDKKALAAILQPREHSHAWFRDLNPDTSYRSQAYMLSHFSRVTLDLVSTCLSPLERAYGINVITQFLEDYFSEYPAQNPLIFNNLEWLVDFARSRPESEAPAARAVEWTWQAWQILHTPRQDYVDDPTKIGRSAAQLPGYGHDSHHLDASFSLAGNIMNSDLDLLRRMFPNIERVCPADTPKTHLAFLKSTDHELTFLIVSDVGKQILHDLASGMSLEETCNQKKHLNRDVELNEIRSLFATISHLMTRRNSPTVSTSIDGR